MVLVMRVTITSTETEMAFKILWTTAYTHRMLTKLTQTGMDSVSTYSTYVRTVHCFGIYEHTVQYVQFI